MQKLYQDYQEYISVSNIYTKFDLQAEHSFPTDGYGNDCDYLGSPFINDCGYDAAGDLLQYLYGNLSGKVTPINNNILEISQAKFIPGGLPPNSVGLYDSAYVYVPSSCNSGALCALHISFHGCEQTIDLIGDKFYTYTGYNGWAEANDIIVLYPQAAVNALINPKGCFDWWGYAGTAYATKLGIQMATVKNMVNYLSL